MVRHKSNSISDLFNLTTSDATIMSQNRAVSKLIEILISFECLSENKRYLYFDKSNDLRETKYNMPHYRIFQMAVFLNQPIVLNTYDIFISSFDLPRKCLCLPFFISFSSCFLDKWKRIRHVWLV